MEREVQHLDRRPPGGLDGKDFSADDREYCSPLTEMKIVLLIVGANIHFTGTGDAADTNREPARATGTTSHSHDVVMDDTCSAKTSWMTCVDDDDDGDEHEVLFL